MLVPIYIYFLGNLIHVYDFKFHLYTDDTQIFIFCLYLFPEFQTDITNFLLNISVWMHIRHFKLNVSQNKFLIPFHVPQQSIFLFSFTPSQLMTTLSNLSSYLDQNPWSQVIVSSLLKMLQWLISIIRRAKAFWSLTLLPTTSLCSYFSQLISF